jgi:hypothetical protein
MSASGIRNLSTIVGMEYDVLRANVTDVCIHLRSAYWFYVVEPRKRFGGQGFFARSKHVSLYFVSMWKARELAIGSTVSTLTMLIM